ncbi:hypothetical protein BLSTO_06177 [Blastocystis sp. subtype 1]
MTHILFTNRKGVPLPTELPKSLIPPSKASLIVAPAPVVEEEKKDDAFDFGFGAPTQPAPAVEEKKDDAFDFGFGAAVAPTQPQPAPVEKKKDDVFDFGFGAPSVEEKKEKEKPIQPPMPKSQGQPPMMPPKPAQPQGQPPMMPPKPVQPQGQPPMSQPPMMPPKPAQPQGQPTSMPQPAAMPVQPAGNDPFATTPQERGFYQQLFMQLDKDNSHLLPHDLVIGYHSQSGLPRPVLEKFWTSLSS